MRPNRPRPGEFCSPRATGRTKVYLILQGKVTIYKQDGDGSEIELATFGKGEFFGEMALFERGVRSAAVRVVEACEFFVFDGEQFLAMVLG